MERRHTPIPRQVASIRRFGSEKAALTEKFALEMMDPTEMSQKAALAGKGVSEKPAKLIGKVLFGI